MKSDAAPPLTPKPQVSLSLVCYGYNEQESIEKFFVDALNLLSSVTQDFEVIFVNDGSTDSTLDIANASAAKDNRIRILTNERNMGIGPSFKRGVFAAQKEILFWQTIDWSYDISQLRIFVELLNYYDVVIGVRPVPIRPLSYIPLIRSIYRVRTRSDDFLRAMVSLTNYYVLRLLFGVNAHDFQNIQFHRTATIQSYALKGNTSFLGIEMIISSLMIGSSILEVPIRFIPRQKGTPKGIQPRTLVKSCMDIISNWLSWGWRIRLERKPMRGKIIRLINIADIEENIIVLCAPLFKHYR